MKRSATESEENGDPQENLLEQILDPANLERAWKRVKANKGAPGIDGISIAEFPAFARTHLPRIMTQIQEGRYKPAPVRRVWITKPDGGQRPLGIPTVLDRVIQQAVAQVLGPIFDADFSESSYGFRYGRRAQAAVERVREASEQGYRWAVDCDLKSYFDTVNHDLLMHWIGRKIRDKRTLRLIGKYLRAGVRHENGETERTRQGVPQGGPLSPLLANIMLDPLDKWVEAMGLPFARYADDFIILTRNRTEAVEAMTQVRAFVEGQLRLLVNEDKSRIAKLKDCSFLGFQIRGKQIKRSEKSAHRFETRIRELTSRSRGVSMTRRLQELRAYTVGWFHYFKAGLTYAETLRWDQWIRRRIRLCFWKDWKRPGKRRRMLIRLGVASSRAKLASRSRKGYWRMSSNSLVQIALNDTYLHSLGLPSLRKLWISFKYGNPT